MSETNQRAGLFPWPKTSLRCGVYACNRQASYILRHKQGLFGDTHFPLCEECVKDIVRNLPEELRDLVAVKPQDVTPADALSVVQFVQYVNALKDSPIMQALVKGDKVDLEVRKALGGLIDMLAEAGAEVEVPPEGQKPLPDEIPPLFIPGEALTPEAHGNDMPEGALLPGGQALTPKPDRRRPDFGEASQAGASPRSDRFKESLAEMKGRYDDMRKEAPRVFAEHDAKLDLTCPLCGAGPFKSKNALNGHMSGKHGGWPK